MAAALLAGCEAGYYAQLVRGGWDVLSRGKPIADLVSAPGTDPELRQRLVRALEAREFAVRELRLPDTGSFLDYADLGRPAVLWNVFAAPELSLDGHEWCHPFAGCLAYRGYYARDAAQREAARLRGQGFDVHVGAVPAYSTLGWFADPLLSTVIGDEVQMIGTIFHELAHQRRFVAGDTAFNESLASFVEAEGLRQFLHAAPDLAATAERESAVEDAAVALFLAARERLEALYKSNLSDDDKRRDKARILDDLRRSLEGLGLVPGTLNNARLLTVGLYRRWVPAFERLYAQAGRDWERFYAATLELAELDPAARERRLEALTAP